MIAIEVRKGSVALAISIVVACCLGCAGCKTSTRWSLESEEIPGFLARIASSTDAFIWIASVPRPLVTTADERAKIIKALRNDTHGCTIDESLVEVTVASYGISFAVYLVRGPSAIIIGLDDYGFGMGKNDRFRFVNPSLSLAVGEVFRRNGLLDSEFGEDYRELLTSGGRDYGAGIAGVTESRVAGSEAVHSIGEFLDGAGDEDIVLLIEKASGRAMWCGPRGAQREALLRSIVKGCRPVRSVERTVSAPSQEDGLVIVLTDGTESCIIRLDLTGFRFGSHWQYRFDNPMLAREITKVLEAQGILRSPGSLPELFEVALPQEQVSRYRDILERAARR